MFNFPAIRKVFEGVASRHEMYALFNRHNQSPFDDDRMNGTRYVGEWFEISEADHDRMFEILPPLFYRGDMFAMREFLAASVTSVFFALRIDDRSRRFHGYCDLSDRPSLERMRAEIIARESRPVRAMSDQEKRDHIWSTTGPNFRGYADARFPADLRNRQIVLVYSSAQGKIWKLLDDLTAEEIASKLPVQFRQLVDTAAA
ncbi:DUF1419 domain-containing protein [Agrobacterium arsenijevicii]|uniref:DUF1419 domain-containing protein n=1 Tax=Agrobacterium arsenijevicii TaxID=1585697 RepID=A0ABR5CYV4_9HYPH|nr:hypothetical protein RP75_28740 [Agrobacterium arsenijevicii]